MSISEAKVALFIDDSSKSSSNANLTGLDNVLIHSITSIDKVTCLVIQFEGLVAPAKALRRIRSLTIRG